MQKNILAHLIAAVFLAFVGAVYEHFSHGVYSYYMIYGFGFPLVMGAVLYTILLMKGKHPRRVFLNLWNSAIAAFSVGSVFAGVLAIYGTTNALVVVYPIAGGALALAAVVSLFVSGNGRTRESKSHEPKA